MDTVKELLNAFEQIGTDKQDNGITQRKKDIEILLGKLHFETRLLFRQELEILHEEGDKDIERACKKLKSEIDGIRYEKAYLDNSIQVMTQANDEEELLKGIDLVDEAVYHEATSSMEVEDISNITLHRLEFEVNHRNSLLKDIESKKIEINKVEKETEDLNAAMKELPALIKEISSVSKKLETSLGLNFSQKTDSNREASTLSDPLYLLYSNFQSFEELRVEVVKVKENQSIVSCRLAENPAFGELIFEFSDTEKKILSRSSPQENLLYGIFPEDEESSLDWVQRLAGINILGRDRKSNFFQNISVNEIILKIIAQMKKLCSIENQIKDLVERGRDFLPASNTWKIFEVEVIKMNKTREVLGFLEERCPPKRLLAGLADKLVISVFDNKVSWFNQKLDGYQRNVFKLIKITARSRSDQLSFYVEIFFTQRSPQFNVVSSSLSKQDKFQALFEQIQFHSSIRRVNLANIDIKESIIALFRVLETATFNKKVKRKHFKKELLKLR